MLSHYIWCICIHAYMFTLIYVVFCFFLLIIVLLLLLTNKVEYITEKDSDRRFEPSCCFIQFIQIVVDKIHTLNEIVYVPKLV